MRIHPASVICSVAILAGARLFAQNASSQPIRTDLGCVSTECHANILSGKVLHGPVAQQKCAACHNLADADAHVFTLTVPKRELCTFCHVQDYRTVVHKPLEDGDCMGCHDPHGTDHRFLLVADAAGGLCFRCHTAENYAEKKHVHGPVAAGACIVCHEAHSSWNPKLLVRNKQDLCFFCHEDVVSRLKLVRHPHPPVVSGDCLRCHDPHASDNPAQIRLRTSDLCFSCHEHEHTQTLLETSAHVHGAVKSEASCLACHLGHGGSMPKLLAAPLMNLCLSCHDQPVQTPSGGQLANMATLLGDNPDHHGPVRRADCVACHNPHASPNFRLLRKEYPELFYAPFDLQNYDLCFTCHVQELVTMENGLGVTGFRDGERNLHFVHVNKEKKGRTCRACHEVHASKHPFHIRDKVPFGGWEIEINFEPNSNGGTCAPGCHEPHVYRREPGEARTNTPAGLKPETKP